jgi:hypothetical protein
VLHLCRHAGVFFLNFRIGVTLNHDALVRTVYYKDLYYPKEVYIRDSVIMKSVNAIANKKALTPSESKTPAVEPLSLIFPFGCTLQIRV